MMFGGLEIKLVTSLTTTLRDVMSAFPLGRRAGQTLTEGLAVQSVGILSRPGVKPSAGMATRCVAIAKACKRIVMRESIV